MLFIANWLVIIVFWFFAIRSWRNGQRRLAIACGALWITGRIWLPGSGLNGGLLFIVVAAILCLILLYADLVHRTLPATNKANAEQLLQQQEDSGK
jgi:uncharacterized membrane protein